jgi:hypothetical protein
MTRFTLMFGGELDLNRGGTTPIVAAVLLSSLGWKMLLKLPSIFVIP